MKTAKNIYRRINRMDKGNSRGRKKDIKSKGGMVGRQRDKLIEKREGIKKTEGVYHVLGI